VTADVCLHALLSGDLILLCSDGLTSMVPDPMIAAILAQHESDEDLETTCKELIDRAKQHGGDDNVTVILCRYV
jgi:protein phosphatase